MYTFYGVGVLFHHCDGQPGFAHKSMFAIADLDTPDLGFTPNMYWSGNSSNLPAADRADVVGVDIKTNAHVVILIHAAIGGITAQGFCQCN